MQRNFHVASAHVLVIIHYAICTCLSLLNYYTLTSFHYCTQTNTFQCVLATDGVRSFALLFYLDEGIQWGEGAQIGLDGVSSPLGISSTFVPLSFSLPGALTNDSVNIELTENTGIAGKYAFRLDTATVLEAGRKLK